ncbi:aminopeptidase [Kurthia sibirica]|uniref:Aminopeptidase n=1 Tax=Kurthia sibirica TaxID=202750 RepID=A0A2U3AL80_9BACL|nr:aminopeptidase [Kurthia sibirica]PWI25288.1 aminopeptidase [Kurthia sibirica]GEK34654.1 aminopeptidase AmpS [Kurthia sibirica]
MINFQQKLENYAELAIKVGANLQKGQYLYVDITVKNIELAQLITKKAYEAGAKEVFINYEDDVITRLHYDHAPLDAFEQFPVWQSLQREWLAEEGCAFIKVKSSSPDLLKGVDHAKLIAAQKSAGIGMAIYRSYAQANKISWTVMAAPSKDWAATMFSHLAEHEQVPALWQAIFAATRADVDNPIEAWHKHDALLSAKVAELNEKNFHKLHYTAPGTDLMIELPQNHIWSGGGSKNADGFDFMANIPTEEVFTAPFKDGVDGYVSSTKPLSYSGNIIDQFKITFEKGRITGVEASQGEEILKNLIATDEGSHYLGEVALVPHHSPISDSGLLYYNTLFDENASNHLAIGSAYAFCVKDGTSMTADQLAAAGLNRSLTHVDFMIGSAYMNIDGITQDGTSVAVFRDGNWAF